METPTISKKEAKKTLSGKKRKAEVIKNVLAKPYENYWPILTTEDNDHLNETLRKLLPRFKYDKVNIPFKEIKAVPKEERKQFRKNYVKQAPLATTESERQSIVFGINDVSKLLESRGASSVLVDSNVQPRLLVQHIIDEAVLYNVPVVVVSSLRDVFKSKCGISGAAVAFKKSIKPDSTLGLIQQTIHNIYENYPVPKTHIHYHRRLDNLELSSITICDSVVGASDSEAEDEVKDEQKNYHLTKEFFKKRAFVPEDTEKDGSTAMTQADNDIVFINLNSSFEENSPVKSGAKRKLNYQPLTVKRLKGDKNRNKRKMESFKKK